MRDESPISSLTDDLIDAFADATNREVVTLIESGSASSVAYWRCDLVGGDVTQMFDHSFLDVRNAPLLRFHHRVIGQDDVPLRACFERFLRLARLFKEADSDERQLRVDDGRIVEISTRRS